LAATALFWLATTIGLAVAVPAIWAQTQVVDADGFQAAARSAARDPQLRQALASELATHIVALAKDQGYDLDSDRTRDIAFAYTASPPFPDQFAQAAWVAHKWLFTGPGDQGGDGWTVNLAPMLSGISVQAIVAGLGVDVPPYVPVVLDDGLRPGQLQPFASWGRWVGVGAAVLTGAAALLTLAIARRRGKALAALGISAVLVGAGGWAAIAVAQRPIDHALRNTSIDIHRIADVMLRYAEDSAHTWLTVTLSAGGILVILGVVLTLLGSYRRRN
jgi:hypothetical protein